MSDRQRVSLLELVALIGLLALIVLFAVATGITKGKRTSYQEVKRFEHIDGLNPEHHGILEWLTHDAAGFFTFALVGVGALQAYLFVYQFRLIREGLRDGERAARAAEKAANAAEQQAHLAKETLIASNRAWLKIGVPIVSSDLVIDDRGMFLRVNIPFENVGSTPALSVNPQFWIMFHQSGEWEKSDFAGHCEKLRQVPGSLEFTLFPGQKSQDLGAGYGYPAFASQEVIASGTVVSNGPNAIVPGRRFLNPMLCGCLTYKIGTDERLRQTRFVYRINPQLDVGNQMIAKERVKLMPFDFFGSFYAD